ncbi:MAG: hypothetical protein AABX08_01110 [Nanoarchaeota archaeon]
MKISTGKRGKVHKFLNFAVKVKNKESKAVRRLVNEAAWLKKLNKYGIGPRLYYSSDRFIITQYVKGEAILDFFKKCSFLEKIEVIKQVFTQCRIMDKLHVDKLEMHRPLKHVIINKKNNKLKVIMIDFERCKYSKSPKNVTQFAQFLISRGFKVSKGALIKILKQYKKDFSDLSYNKIVNFFLSKNH